MFYDLYIFQCTSLQILILGSFWEPVQMTDQGQEYIWLQIGLTECSAKNFRYTLELQIYINAGMVSFWVAKLTAFTGDTKNTAEAWGAGEEHATGNHKEAY